MASSVWCLVYLLLQFRVEQQYVHLITLLSLLDADSASLLGIGTFQQYYQTELLQRYSPGTISWIPSLQIFFMFAMVSMHIYVDYLQNSDRHLGSSRWQTLRSLRATIPDIRWVLSPCLRIDDDVHLNRVLSNHAFPKRL